MSRLVACQRRQVRQPPRTPRAQPSDATIPIVGMSSGDPVRSGLVASLNRPGGNVTAVGLFTFSLGTKRFELLRELIPNAKVIAVLANPSDPDPEAATDLKEVEIAARAVGQQLSVLNASSEHDFEPAFATISQQGAGALLVMADPFFNSQRAQLIALAARHAIPAIYEWRGCGRRPDVRKSAASFEVREVAGGKSSDARSAPRASASRMRAFDRDLIRGGHYGQPSCEPHQQAEHMAAPTKSAT
jgi:ABC transporter substrate binding protein